MFNFRRWHIPFSFPGRYILKMPAPVLFPCNIFNTIHVWADKPGTIDVGHTMGFRHVSEMRVRAFTKKLSLQGALVLFPCPAIITIAHFNCPSPYEVCRPESSALAEYAKE